MGIFSIVPRSSDPSTEKTCDRGAGSAPRPQTFSQTSRYWAPVRSPVSGLAAEITLQRAHLEIAGKLGLDPLGRGNGSRKSGVVWNFMQEGGPAQRPAVGQRGCPFRGVEYQLNPAIGDPVDDMGPAFQNLVDLGGLDPVGGQEPLRAGGRDDLETEPAQ